MRASRALTRHTRRGRPRRSPRRGASAHSGGSVGGSTMAEQKWPDALWIVRHGQSAGNVAREEAERAAVPLIDIATRDMDTPLSKLGEQQATALGRWFGALARDMQPTVALCSPYVRALATTRMLLDTAGVDLTM